MKSEKPKILLAEDEENLGKLLKDYLNAKGYETVWCTDGQLAYDAFIQESFDICLFDIMMPVKDGITLAKEIRMNNTNIPIIFLTAKSLSDDKIEGFKSGADDYITKPFNMEELLLRIHAVLKRTNQNLTESETDTVFQLGKYSFDSMKQTLQIGDDSRKLTSKESELLRLLSLNSNKVLDRNFTLKSIWQDDSYFNARSMDVYITKLRKYLKDDESVQILNIHGKGFKLLVSAS